MSEGVYKVFVKKGCGTCMSVKSVLRSKGIPFEEIDVETEAGLWLAHQHGVMSTGSVFDPDWNPVSIESIVSKGVCLACS